MKKSMLSVLAVLSLSAAAVCADAETPVCATEECQAQDLVASGLKETRSRVAILAHEDAVVMKNFDAFAEILQAAYHTEKSMTAEQILEISSALEFAAEKHRFQTRKNPEKT